MKTLAKFTALFLTFFISLQTAAQEKQASTEEFNWTIRTMPDGIRIDQHEAMINSVEEWKQFYKDKLGKDVDFLNVRIPKKKVYFDQLIIVANDVTPNQIFDACRSQFKCYSLYSDLNKAITHNDRSAEAGSYAVWVRNLIESDERLKNFSADDLKKADIAGITLPERLLLELFYFRETSSHLDIENWTLCSGSRYSDGNVPYVYWDPNYRRFRVDWAHPGLEYGRLRSREVVF